MKGLFLLLSAVFMICGLRPVSAAYHSAPLPAGDDAKIVRVVNADTIEVTINKIGFTLGLIGLDAPNKGECYEPLATASVRKLLRGQTIRVVRDQSDFDANGRLMRYAYLADGQFLNEIIIKSGYARYANISPDQQQSNLLEKAQQTAQSGTAGLWKTCNNQSSNAVTEKSSSISSQGSCTALNTSGCDTIKGYDRSGHAEIGYYRSIPTGSKLKLPDGFIAIWDGNAVTIYKNEQGEYVSDTVEMRPDPNWPQRISLVESVQGLVYDGPYVRLQRSPNLFLHHGNNNMTALVKIAQYVSGSRVRIPMKLGG